MRVWWWRQLGGITNAARPNYKVRFMEFSLTRVVVTALIMIYKSPVCHSNTRGTPGEPSVWGASPSSTGRLCQADHGQCSLVSNKVYKVVLTTMLIIRFLLYYCPQDLAFQFRLIGPHHQSCYSCLMTTCLAYMHWWWYLLSARSSHYGLSSTWSRHSTTPRKFWPGWSMQAMCFPAIFWVKIILHLNCYNISHFARTHSHIMSSIILVSPLSNHF